MPVINMPIHITIQEAEFLNSGELFTLYQAALEKEELARQKSINSAVKRIRVAEKTAQLFGYEIATRVMHLT